MSGAAKLFRVLLAVAFAAGACLTARAGYLHVKAALAGMLIRDAWSESAGTGRPTPPWPWADTYPIARLRIPRIGYDEIVLEGATPRTLAFGPARLRSGVAPGEPGNLVLAGHRTSWFRPLQELRAGDAIEVQWFDVRTGKLRRRLYTVTSLRVTSPQEAELAAAEGADRLTLLTCYPFGRGPTSPLRLVVRAAPSPPVVQSAGVAQADEALPHQRRLHSGSE